MSESEEEKLSQGVQEMQYLEEPKQKLPEHSNCSWKQKVMTWLGLSRKNAKYIFKNSF
ncbi:unnamed protein product [Thelazia callipaeda]|uniref:Synaptonemal complex protein 2 n=1 Tax=Thelazia callipaeda TaxID=103827 RepID=A0A0N5CTN4_THECL|nr:unnamed protein product [Thelazia callipaeda]